MTLTSHALAGAAVAVVVKEPLLALPLAFLSHLALDAIPHYEPKGVTSGFNSGVVKIKLRSFKIFLVADVLVCTLLLAAIPIWLSGAVAWWVTLSCMLLTTIPDITWGWHLYRARIGKKVTHYTLYTRLHGWVQWKEAPWGIWVELAFCLATLWLISAMNS